MDRMIRLALLVVLLVLVACTEKTPEKSPETAQGTAKPAVDYGRGWSTWGLYTEQTLTAAEKALVGRAGPAGGEGETGLGFERDFDGDGKTETVAYGWFTRGGNATELSTGNFVLVTRGSGAAQKVLLLQEFDNPPAVTVFTLKTDKSLVFGGGIEAGEVIWKLNWPGKPRVTSLLD